MIHFDGLDQKGAIALAGQGLYSEVLGALPAPVVFFQQKLCALFGLSDVLDQAGNQAGTRLEILVEDQLDQTLHIEPILLLGEHNA